ncbi:unnamed protein product, partial [Rotaria magnacalcarata]
VWMAKEIRGKVLFIELIRFFSIQICEKQIHGLISKEIDDMDKTSSLLLVI